MFKRQIMFAALLALSLLGALPTAAQSSDSNWSAYLYESSTQQLVRVALDDTQKSIDLSLPPGAYVGQDSIDFTSDGNHAAYCATISTAGDNRTHLFVQNFATPNAQPLSVDLGVAQGCAVKYSADGTQIVVSVVRYFAGDSSADTSVSPWSLIVVDAATGTQLYEMNPSKMGASFDASRTIMPDVRYFSNNQVIFAALPWGGEGSASSPAYLWQLSDGSLQTIDRWWRSGLDSLDKTGELAWTELDPSKPAAQSGGPVPQANVVKLADKSGQERVVYASPDWLLLETKFINNGQQLAISELQGGSDSQMPQNPATRWIALDRAGMVTELATTTGFSQLAGAPNGYVYLWASDNSATPVLTLDYYSGKQKVTLWTQQESNSISWSLLWTAPTAAADGLQPFSGVAQ